ncbi:hypothetical protein ACFO0M_00575 [Micromonospora mangrovi]|uniref:Uncharacterized protein n=2 Tax=Micromonospora TaxID=1873 RepID=A0AAU7MAU7_9ACTN
MNQQIRDARKKARDAQLRRELIEEELGQTRQSLSQAARALDSLTSGSSSAGHVRTRSWGQLTEELLRTQAELSETKLLLAQARTQLVLLGGELALLNDRLTERAGTATAGQPESWYRPTVASLPHWNVLRQLLCDRQWRPDQIARLDKLSTDVVSRLSDPRSEATVQRRGLIVGYPQAGMTTDMTAIVAKAIDAGYRFVIVFSGPYEAIRRQLQSRLDDHLAAPAGTSDVFRLTDELFDYKSLAAQVGGLRFEKSVHSAPLNDDRNLAQSGTRLIVVKKNLALIKRLVNDLKKISTPLDEIPVLIVDMDADSTSFSERRALGLALTKMIDMLPRAQYVGLVASPLSVELSQGGSAATLSPYDFILSVSRPEGYFGLRELNSPAPISSGFYLAHVRTVDRGSPGLREAMDMFVLSAAVRAYREGLSGGGFSPHRMLIIGPMRLELLEELRGQVFNMWKGSNFDTSAGRVRLRNLFESDIRPVSRHEEGLLPGSFEELLPSLDGMLDWFRGYPIEFAAEVGSSPFGTIVVSSPQKAGSLNTAGLTVVYLDAPARLSALPVIAAASGFRTGYQDLVRIYVPDESDGDGNGFRDHLAAYRDADEKIREDLASYALPYHGNA